MSSPKPPGFKQRRAWHFVEVSDPVGPVRLGSVSQSSSSNVNSCASATNLVQSVPMSARQKMATSKDALDNGTLAKLQAVTLAMQLNGKMAKYHGYLSCKD